MLLPLHLNHYFQKHNISIPKYASPFNIKNQKTKG